MIDFSWLDSHFTLRLCLTLLHSVWQFAPVGRRGRAADQTARRSRALFCQRDRLVDWACRRPADRRIDGLTQRRWNLNKQMRDLLARDNAF